MASKTGCTSPGELEITRSTSAAAACCSRASASSQVRAFSRFSNSADGVAARAPRLFALIRVERADRPRARRIGALRGKITSSTRSVAPCRSSDAGPASRLRPSAALLTLTAVHGREQPRVDLPESISLGGKPIKGSLHLHQRHLGHRAARRRTAALRAGWPAARAAPFALGLGNLLGLGRDRPLEIFEAQLLGTRFVLDHYDPRIADGP